MGTMCTRLIFMGALTLSGVACHRLSQGLGRHGLFSSVSEHRLNFSQQPAKHHRDRSTDNDEPRSGNVRDDFLEILGSPLPRVHRFGRTPIAD